MIWGAQETKLIARVFVTLKPGVLDPAGKAVQEGLRSLGYREVEEVRLGKYLELTLDSSDRASARARVEEMCRKLLANTVVENYRVEIE
jgi:phosphoribosylformylglycinamidine synthase PurS subunit